MPEEAVFPDQEDQVNWGLPTGVGALLLSLGIYVVAATIFRGVAPSLYQQHQLLWEVLAYQFLVLAIIVSTITLVLIPHDVNLRALGYRFPGWSTLVTAASVVIVIFVGIAIIVLIFQTFFPSYQLQGNAHELVHGKHPRIGIPEEAIVLLWAGIEVPLVEETLFRGILYQALRNFFERWLPFQAGVLIAAIISGAIFGAVHGEPHTLPILIFLGIVLAYVFQLGRSIYASAVVHGIINAIAIVNVFHG